MPRIRCVSRPSPVAIASGNDAFFAISPRSAPTAPADAAAAQGNRQQVQIDAARLQQLCKDLQGPKKLEFREAIAGGAIAARFPALDNLASQA